MTTPRTPDHRPEPSAQHDPPPGGGHGGGHRWMMIACCIPMLAIAGILVLTGVAGTSFLFAAIACTVMMAMMMGVMGHGGGDDTPR